MTLKLLRVLYLHILLAQCGFIFGNPEKTLSSLDTAFYLPEITLINPTFLGNPQRNYYGNLSPDTLEVIWSLYLGKGKTVISRAIGTKIWEGAGWTGQPLLVKEDTSLFIIQGAYDHHLKKINALTGEIVWQYPFDDVIKGTGSIWQAPESHPPEDRLLILQGSRLGVGNYLDSKHIPSYRAISYFTGKEKWRLDVKWTDSYSRDVDGSALILDTLAYIGLENSLFTIIDPSPSRTSIIDSMCQPSILLETPLYKAADVVSHKNNIVTESSPCLINGIIYVASGSGHVYGFSLKEQKLVWDFFIGSDMDGSPVVTSDECLLVSVEKQYIKGHGGVFKLDPKKNPSEAVVWYYPVADTNYYGWEGGVIGSCAVNDQYSIQGEKNLAAFMSLDGYLTVIEHTTLSKNDSVWGPGNDVKYPTPLLVDTFRVGSSISSPLFVNNHLIACSYNGIFLFKFNANLKLQKLDHFGVSIESTPVVHDSKVYIASRNGYFYCLGKKK